MDFEERLRHAFDALSDRLHNDITGQLTSAIGELSATVKADRAEAVDLATREATDRAARAASDHLAASVSSAEKRAHDQFVADERAAAGRLRATTSAIDQARSLTEIFDALVRYASTEVGRAGVLVVEVTGVRGWKFTGFGEPLDGGGSELALSFANAGILIDAIESGNAVCTGDGQPSPSPSVAPEFAQLAKERDAVAVPLVMAGQPFALLYADEGNGEKMPHASSSWAVLIEVAARYAARAIEALTAQRVAQLQVDAKNAEMIGK